MVEPTVSSLPARGDLVYVNFNPTQGHEQRGQRPALVLSPQTYNAKSSLVLVMPITKHQKGYPFEVILPPGLTLEGVILVDQIQIAPLEILDKPQTLVVQRIRCSTNERLWNNFGLRDFTLFQPLNLFHNPFHNQNCTNVSH